MTITFVHAADLHLGSPLHGLEGASAEMATRLSRATETAFERIVSIAVERDVDFLVVAGDLYDREARSVRANQFLVEQFERLEATDIPAFVVHGNHDPLGRGAEKLDLPENVTVFGTETVESALYGDPDAPDAEILGRSYGSRHEGTNVTGAYTPERPTIPTIGVLHTGLDPDGREYVPCSPRDLATQDVTYWALGHVHDTRILDGAPGAYPGIPQPRHVGEPAVGGCLLVELDDGSEPTIEFAPTGSIVWQTSEIDTGTVSTEDDDRRISNLTDLENHLTDVALDFQDQPLDEIVTHPVTVAETDWSPAGVICRWELTGRSDIHEVLEGADEGTDFLTDRLRERLQDVDPFVWTETVRDRTRPPLPDRETLAEEHDVIAQFLDLTDELRTDPEARETMREAAGGAWEWVADPDRTATRTDRVTLNEDRLDDLIDEAEEIAVPRLAATRYDVD